jgi:hypothetical protein
MTIPNTNTQSSTTGDLLNIYNPEPFYTGEYVRLATLVADIQVLLLFLLQDRNHVECAAQCDFVLLSF